MENIVESTEIPCGIRAAHCTISDKTGFLQKIQDIAGGYQAHIICFDADKLAGIRHVQAALVHARRSFKNGKQISNTFEMESLLYAAGSRQTSVAASFGLHDGKNRLYIACCPEREGVWKQLGCLVELCHERDPWGEISPEKQAHLMELFDISNKELGTTTPCSFVNLVLERVAMLDVYR